MNCHQVNEIAGDFLAGRLPPEQAGEVSAHLAGCSRCRLEVDQLRVLLEAARELPRSVEPPRDLWLGVLNRIEGTPGRWSRVVAAPRPSPRLVPLLATAAAVALLLLLLGPGLVERLRPVTLAYSDLNPVEVVDLEFTRLLACLQADVEETVTLPSEAARTLREGLRIIDQAIAETKAAAEHYPGDPDLQRRLAGSYQTKLELLRRTTSYSGGTEVLY
jgi:anti-sigma factor RsiW